MIPAARLTLGPPGCGKTSKLVADVRDELHRGTAPDSIAIVTFTRAARDEVAEKLWDEFGLTQEDLPWLRTIHSTAYRLLGIQRNAVFTDKMWSEFAEQCGYDLTAAPAFDEQALGPAQLSSRTADDDLLLAREWGRNRRLPRDAALARCPTVVPRRRFRLFCDRVESFKQERGLIEFSDMLSRALELGTRPPVTVAFIDEAQDLSPAQVALAEMWFRDCARVEIAADDDQAVYGFSGADPSWLIAYSEQVPTRVLEQSRRVRSNVHEVANRIIGRNQARAPKTWKPAGRGGSVAMAEANDIAALVSDGRPSFVLVRNRQHIHALAKKLFDASVPYVIDGRGGPNPLGNPHLRIAIQAAQAARRGSPVGAAELRVLMKFVPIACPEALLPVGAKKRIEDVEGNVAPDVLRTLIGRGNFLNALRRNGPTGVMLRLPPSTRTYVQRLLERHSTVPTPHVVLTTIHASKGREADRVIVATDMTRNTWAAYQDPRGYEAENRVWYVAATRSRDELVWLRPRSRRHFDAPRTQTERRGV